MRTLVCSNILTEIPTYSYISHCQLFYRLGKEYPGDEFMSFFPHRTSIDNARNLAARIALENDCDYLLFYDDDMDLHQNTYKSLREANKDIVMALSYIRGYPFHPMFFKEIGNQNGNVLMTYYDDYEKYIDENGLVTENVGAVGFATVLIKTELFKRTPLPFFVTGAGMTEDVYFCRKVKMLYPEVEIAVDTKVPTGHILNPELVRSDNVKELRKFYGKGEEEIPPAMIVKDFDAKDIMSWITQ